MSFKFLALLIVFLFTNNSVWAFDVGSLVSQDEYHALGNLNKDHFGHFNGSVGTFRGRYEIEGAGYHEAFIAGWTYVKINSNLTKIKNHRNQLIARATSYSGDILDNVVLKTLANGRKIKMIDSAALSRAQVKNKFLQKFTNKDSSIRKRITKF